MTRLNPNLMLKRDIQGVPKKPGTHLMGGRVIMIKRTLCFKTLTNIFEMAQLSNEPRVFVVETYFRTNGNKKVKEACKY